MGGDAGASERPADINVMRQPASKYHGGRGCNGCIVANESRVKETNELAFSIAFESV